MLTSEIEVIKGRNQTWQFYSTYCYESLQMEENMGIKAYNYVFNILPLSSIIHVGKRSGGFEILSRYFSKMLSIFKIMSQYFSKMLSIPRYRVSDPSLHNSFINVFSSTPFWHTIPCLYCCFFHCQQLSIYCSR